MYFFKDPCNFFRVFFTGDPCFESFIRPFYRAPKRQPGPRSDYDLWKVRSTGPAAGITFGDRWGGM